MKSQLKQSPVDEVAGSYQPINEFFSCFSLPLARQYLLSAIKAAESETIWNKKEPSDLLWFFEELDKLITAVFSVLKEDKKIKQALLLNADESLDPSQTHLYCASFNQHQVWDFFPRNLTAKEYCDPYKALQKFTDWASKKEWKEHLRNILSYALDKGSLAEMDTNIKLVKMTECLLKMLDACHIIFIRTLSIYQNS